MRRNVFFLYAFLCIVDFNGCEPDISDKVLNRYLKDYGTSFGNRTSSTESSVKQTGDPDEKVPECITENGESGVCVTYYLCEHGTNKVIEDGHGLIRKRSSEQCPGELDRCCLRHQVVLDSSAIPSATSPVDKDDNTKSEVDPSPPASIQEPIESSSPRIIGNYGYSNPGANILSLGEGLSSSDSVYADFGEFPWMVALLKGSKDDDWRTSNYIGGGSLIHPLVVMTVAHILENLKAYQINVRVGEYDTNSDDELYKHQERNVAEIVVHPQYVRRTLCNDIGLLFLDAPVILRDAPHIGIGSLALLQPLPGSVCFTMGWGAGNFANKTVFASILQKVKLTIKGKNKCEEDFRKTHVNKLCILHESLFCASEEESIDNCRGDEGSSLVCPVDKGDSRFAIYGMVAHEKGCVYKDMPGLYVNVPNLSEWVGQQLGWVIKGTKNLTLIE